MREWGRARSLGSPRDAAAVLNTNEERERERERVPPNLIRAAAAVRGGVWAPPTVGPASSLSFPGRKSGAKKGGGEGGERVVK